MFSVLFRGALDVLAKEINEEMKIAAVKAIAALAKEDVPDDIKAVYGGQNIQFGRDYILPSQQMND